MPPRRLPRLPNIRSLNWFWAATGAAGIIVCLGLSVWWWNRPATTKEDRLSASLTGLNCVAYSPDLHGQYLAVGSGTGGVSLWETATRESVFVKLPTRLPITALTISADGWLVVGGVEQYVIPWEIRGHEAKLIPAFAAPVTALQSRPRNVELAVGLSNGELFFVNTQTANIASIPSQQEGGIKALAFNAAGTQLVSGGTDGKLICRSAASRKVFRVIDAHTNEVSSIAFSPDQKRFVSGGWDNAARVWDLDDLALRVELPHPDALSGVGFANGYVVTACWDGTLRFWSFADRRIVAEFDCGEPIHALAVHPSGMEVVTVSQSEWVRFWKTPAAASR